MENFGNESLQLNRLLEKHKQLQERSAFKSMYESQATQNNLNYFNSVNNGFNATSHLHHQNVAMAENKIVYVNPNYKPKVYVNPQQVNMVPPPAVNPHFNMMQPPPMINPYVNMGINMAPPMINPYINMMPIVNYANQVTVYPYINMMPSFNHMNQVEVHPQFNMIQPPMYHPHPQVPVSSHINMTNVNNHVNHRIAVNPHKNVIPTVNSKNNHSELESSIHVNPNKLKIRNIQNQNQIQVSQSNLQDSLHKELSNIQSKSIHVNPKLIKLRTKNLEAPHISSTQCSTTTTTSVCTAESTASLCNVTDSLQTVTKNELVSSVTSEDIKSEPTLDNCNVVQKKSATNYAKKGSSLKRYPSSNFLAISHRKLIRVRKSPRSAAAPSSTSKLLTPIKRRLSSTSLKKIKLSPKAATTDSTSPLTKINNLRLVENTNLYKNNWYNKVYRSSLKPPCKKMVLDSKKVVNRANSLVSIGGVMYKSSRNKLTLSNTAASTSKRKSSLTSIKSNQYFVTDDGKKLLKLDAEQKKLNVTPVKLNTSISPVKSYKTNASNKVKQRSLQILRNKMKKNNQPCLLFQKFGFCANLLKGTCSKVHDRNQVALCRNFLQGKCLSDNCPLSHNVGPEKMPTCKYFLEGCCTRDGCPYLHVKVSAKSPICVEFLRGYCSRGNECQNRHIHACPEFDKSGKCSKGKFCPYPHKSQLTETKRYRRNSRRKSNTIAKQSENLSKSPEDTLPNRVRYYDEVPGDLNQKRENLQKNLNIIKKVHSAQSDNSDEAQNSVNNEVNNISDPNESVKSEEKLEFVCNKPRRPPIGPLPAYIPID